jgi:hypothetical protein
MSPQEWVELLKVLFPAGIGSLTTAGLILLVILFFPEKVDKWLAILWSGIEKLGILYRYASKERIRHDIQGSVSEFSKHLGRELPDFVPPQVRIEWVAEAKDRRAFLETGKAVIRLRRSDPDQENIATAAMLFVSRILLRKARRYLSPTQREAVELFVGFRMLKSQASEVYDHFVDRWLYPGIEKTNPKIDQYFRRFHHIDEAELFIPVFLQELLYMGDKVFARRRDDAIFAEVDSALQFLEVYANRRLGEKADRPSFNGEACRFAIMIVGMAQNIADERFEVYLKHIRERLLPCGVETIYVIGPARNADFIRHLAGLAAPDFTNPFSRNYRVLIKDRDGNPIESDSHLSVLRSKRTAAYVR